MFWKYLFQILIYVWNMPIQLQNNTSLQKVCGPVRHVPENVCPRLSGPHSRPKAGWRWLSGEIANIFHMAILFVLQATKSNGRNCRGKLRDFVLDWEAELPQEVRLLMPRFFSNSLLLPGSFHVFNFLRTWTCLTPTVCRQTWVLSWAQLCR